MRHGQQSYVPREEAAETAGAAASLDQLAGVSRTLWQAQNNQELLAAWTAIAMRLVAAQRVSFLSVTGPAGDWHWEECPPLADAPVPPMASADIMATVEAFKAVPEISRHKSVFFGEDRLVGVMAFMLGDSGGERFFLVVQGAHAGALPASVRETVGFLAAQAQETFRWMARHERTRALVHRDDLTGLYNYRFLDSSLDSEIRRVQRFQTSFCLLFIDLDNFKPVNDEHGHRSGSRVLKQVADVLKDTLREVDTVFRYGGDEYVVLLLEANSVTGAMAAERIRARIEEKLFDVEGGQTVRLSCSIGVAACPEHGMDKETLLAMADASMYKSKKGGKNRVSVAPDQSSPARERPVGAGLHR